MKTRVRALIIHENSIVLIYREKPDRKYFVFPGGGVESGESPQVALKRECEEELGIAVAVHDKKYTYKEKGADEQHFYYCTTTGGILGTGKGPEFTSGAYSSRGQYHPKSVAVNSLSTLPLFPNEIRDALCADLRIMQSIDRISFREVLEK